MSSPSSPRSAGGCATEAAADGGTASLLPMLHRGFGVSRRAAPRLLDAVLAVQVVEALAMVGAIQGLQLVTAGLLDSPGTAVDLASMGRPGVLLLGSLMIGALCQCVQPALAAVLGERLAAVTTAEVLRVAGGIPLSDFDRPEGPRPTQTGRDRCAGPSVATRGGARRLAFRGGGGRSPGDRRADRATVARRGGPGGSGSAVVGGAPGRCTDLSDRPRSVPAGASADLPRRSADPSRKGGGDQESRPHAGAARPAPHLVPSSATPRSAARPGTRRAANSAPGLPAVCCCWPASDRSSSC